MYSLLQRLSSNWPTIKPALTVGLSLVGALIVLVMRLGGKKRFLEWIGEIECPDQEDAAQRIVCGHNALHLNGGGLTACFEFIGGLDQLRAVQNRIVQGRRRIHRLTYSIFISSGFAIAAFIIRFFELPTGSWSAACIAGAIIGAGWVLWDFVPLAYVAFQNGLPKSAKDKPTNVLTNNSATDTPSSVASNTPK